MELLSFDVRVMVVEGRYIPNVCCVVITNVLMVILQINIYIYTEDILLLISFEL